MRTKIQFDNFNMFSFFLFISFPVLYYIGKLYFPANITHLAIVLLTYLAFFLYLLFYKQIIDRTMIIFACIIIAIFIVYAVINITDPFCLESYAWPTAITASSGIIAFYFMYIQEDSRKIENILKIYVVLYAIYGYLVTIDISKSSTYLYGYDMYLGYLLLLPCIICLYFAFSEKIMIKKAICLAFGLYFIYIILAYCSRGPFIGLFMFFIISILRYFRGRDIALWKKIVILFVIILFMIIFLTSFNLIIMGISAVFDSIGISSRTLSRVLNGSISYDNGRIDLYKEIFAQIPLVGLGPFSDQFVFGEGNYCHNFFLEILFDFGWLFGVPLLIFIVAKILKIFINGHLTEWFGLYCVFFSACFGRLLMSGTFWNETNFWILIALGYMCLRDINNKTINNATEVCK